MNEDYLWDKSGEPDPEIEQLEKTLGSLRFKRPAEPLPLPASPPPRWSFRLSFSPALAAAAALLILLLAGGVWLGLRRSSSKEGRDTIATGTAPVEEKRAEQGASGPIPPIVPNPGDPRNTIGENKPEPVKPDKVAPRNNLPRRFSGAREVTAKHRELNPAPRREQLAREGEQAKAQLIMALHIASDKLNTVQRKIQANPGT